MKANFASLPQAVGNQKWEGPLSSPKDAQSPAEKAKRGEYSVADGRRMLQDTEKAIQPRAG